MRAVIQRVSGAAVRVDGQTVGQIGVGLFVLLGIENADDEKDIEYLAAKIVNMRIFSDDAGLMNRSVIDADGQVLVVSQFTLFGKTRRGNRPSFIDAARPDTAVPLYEAFVAAVESLLGKKVPTGVFGADMKIDIAADGPVTIVMDTKQKDF